MAWCPRVPTVRQQWRSTSGAKQPPPRVKLKKQLSALRTSCWRQQLHPAAAADNDRRSGNLRILIATNYEATTRAFWFYYSSLRVLLLILLLFLLLLLLLLVQQWWQEINFMTISWPSNPQPLWQCWISSTSSKLLLKCLGSGWWRLIKEI